MSVGLTVLSGENKPTPPGVFPTAVTVYTYPTYFILPLLTLMRWISILPYLYYSGVITMFQMFSSMFSALTTLFQGVESYSSAFAKTGEYAEQAVDNWVKDSKAEADRARAAKSLPES